jgi:hypothetical protein
MTLTERYLRAVRDHLPRGVQDDIIRELEGNLQSRLEDETERRGRPLLEADESAILKEFGHPMAVAARYRNDERSLTFGRRLIGPELFPTYLKVLGVNLAITGIVVAIVIVASSGSLIDGVYGALAPFILQFVAVTVLFVIADDRYVRNPDGWDPRKVNGMGPDVDLGSIDGISDQLIGRAQVGSVKVTTSVLEIGLLAAAAVAWFTFGLPERIGVIAPGPGWRDLVGPVSVVIVLALLTPVVTLIRPTATRFRVAAHIVVDVASVALGLLSLSIGSWVVPADPTAAAAAADVSLVALINDIVRISIAISVVLTAVNAALETRRLLRLERLEQVAGSSGALARG